MSLPTLWHLHHHGYALQLVGKRWAVPLLAGCGWPVHTLPGTLRERAHLLRGLARDVRTLDADFDKRLNTLLLTNSFSSALDAWLAGLNTVGYRQDGRGWFLTHPVAQPTQSLHESQRFWNVAAALTSGRPDGLDARTAALPPSAMPSARPAADGRPTPNGSASPAARQAPAFQAPPMDWPTLPLTDDAQAAALKLLRQQGLVQDTDNGQSRILPYACLVPFATGTLKGTSKAWPGFPTLCRQLVPELPVLLMPGPGPETIQARTDYPDAQTLAGVPLDVYAALLAHSAVAVANDTGPGHLAAAVGARLVSVLGPTDASRYRALGPHVTLIQHHPWPEVDTVLQQVHQAIAAARQG